MSSASTSCAYTNAVGDRERRLPRHRRPRRPLLRLRPGHVELQRRRRGSTKANGRVARRQGSARSRATATRTAATGLRSAVTRRRSDPTLEASALRVPDPQAALRAVHAGARRGSVRRAARAVLRVSPRRCARTRDANARARCCYAVGWTQHTVGVQYIRTAAIIQLLLGNIGRPGGGIMALRGHASIQGSTDIPTLYNMLPGYIPSRTQRAPDLATVRRAATRLRPATGGTWTPTS